MAVTRIAPLAPIRAVGAGAALVLAFALPASAQNWNGFYIGLNGGYAWNNDRSVGVTTLPSPQDFNQQPFSIAYSVRGGFVGGQVGYNWRATPQWLLGIETDLAFANLRGEARFDSISAYGSNAPVPGRFHTVHQDMNLFGTVRARLGYLTAEHVLLFGTVGFAYGHIRHSAVQDLGGVGTFVGSTTKMQAGWTAGGGGEWIFTRHWSVKAEYLYIDFGSESVVQRRLNTGPNDVYRVVSAFDTGSHIARIGLNYKIDAR